MTHGSLSQHHGAFRESRNGKGKTVGGGRASDRGDGRAAARTSRLRAGADALGDGRAGALGDGRSRPVVITGGAGFVGTNLAAGLLEDGRRVLVFDNLSRPGVERNLQWLTDRYGDRVEVMVGDVRDALAVRHAVARAGAVYHLAAQVAVTSSLVDPAFDFEVNARGTLNVLEACRGCADPPPLLFTSTNKVYGSLADIRCERDGRRYLPVCEATRRHGVGEERPLEFHSPYGCSKGSADQYVLDYARCYGMPAVVFRMSCIYGPHQCGTEDQGWLAHFARQLMAGRPLSIYGDGWQVRDVLFISDLVDAMRLAVERIGAISGMAFNIGGGPANAVSLMEVIEQLTALASERPQVEYGPWRQGDQKYYVSDTRRFQAAAGWSPEVGVEEGVARLWAWLEGAVAAEPALVQ